MLMDAYNSCIVLYTSVFRMYNFIFLQPHKIVHTRLCGFFHFFPFYVCTCICSHMYLFSRRARYIILRCITYLNLVPQVAVDIKA